MQDRTRAILTLAGCAAGLMLGAPAAIADTADQPEPAIDTPIEADGTVLAETVRPAESAAGEQTCAAPSLFNPLVAFKDQRDYFIAPAGDFEDPSLPGWQLTGGAGVTSGSSPHAVTGEAQASSLSLPPGSSATTPEMCVDLNYPTFRFFVSQLEADTDSDLAVDVIYPALAKNNVRQAKKLKLRAKDGWRLSDDIKLEPQRLGKRSGWRRIAIRFRVEPGKKASAYRVDDILIDPRRLN
jgi:hypothetical protein